MKNVIIAIGLSVMTVPLSQASESPSKNQLLCNEKDDLLGENPDGCFYYDEICFKGNSEEVGKQIAEKNVVWVDDESILDDVIITEDTVSLKIFDSFSFSDQDAPEEHRDLFIEVYTIKRCKN